MEFSCGSEGLESNVTAMAWAAAVAQVQSLAQELLHAMGAAKKKVKNLKVRVLVEVRSFQKAHSPTEK